jgi:hypothetical protein
MIDILAYIVKAETLTAGQRIIEARFNSSNQRVEKSYQVLEVKVGRFVHYTIADEAGVSLRTSSPGDLVEVAGESFAGEVYAA